MGPQLSQVVGQSEPRWLVQGCRGTPATVRTPAEARGAYAPPRPVCRPEVAATAHWTLCATATAPEVARHACPTAAQLHCTPSLPRGRTHTASHSSRQLQRHATPNMQQQHPPPLHTQIGGVGGVHSPRTPPGCTQKQEPPLSPSPTLLDKPPRLRFVPPPSLAWPPFTRPCPVLSLTTGGLHVPPPARSPQTYLMGRGEKGCMHARAQHPPQ